VVMSNASRFEVRQAGILGRARLLTANRGDFESFKQRCSRHVPISAPGFHEQTWSRRVRDDSGSCSPVPC
jgi:hypothetical protein